VSPATDSIVTWTAGRHKRVGRILGIDHGTAIIRDTDGVTRCVFTDQLTPVQAPPAMLRQLGVVA